MHFFVAKLLSIAVMTCSYVYHLRKLCPANSLHTQRINFSMRPQQVRIMGDPTVVRCLLSRVPLQIPAKTLHCQKLESLNNMTAAIVLVYLYLLLLNCFRKPRKDVQDER